MDLKRALPLWSGVAVGSIAVIAAEMTVYAMARGDFMLRMHENERSFMQTKSYLFYEGSRFGWPVGASHVKALLKRLFLDGPGVIFLNVQFLFLPFFGLIAAAYGLYKKDRSFAVPGLWMLTLVLAYNFMTCSFASYTPLVLLERYLHPILLPATVLTAGLLVKVLERPEGALDYAVYRERLFWGSLVASLVFAISAYSAFRQVRDIRDLRAILEIRQLARTIGPNESVYTDPLSGKAFEFFWKFPETTGLTNFEGMRHEQVTSNSYVLVDKYRLDWLNVNVGMWLTKDYGYHAPAFATGAPDGWKRRWRDDNATLYRVE
jgi:hypothetical protein